MVARKIWNNNWVWGQGKGVWGRVDVVVVRERRGENRSMPLGTGGQGGIFFTLVSFPSP